MTTISYISADGRDGGEPFGGGGGWGGVGGGGGGQYSQRNRCECREYLYAPYGVTSNRYNRSGCIVGQRFYCIAFITVPAYTRLFTLVDTHEEYYYYYNINVRKKKIIIYIYVQNRETEHRDTRWYIFVYRERE